jgi:hypothetical protein
MSYYQNYLLLGREEKLSMLMDLFHNPNTTPAEMEAIQKEFQKILHSHNKYDGSSDVIHLGHELN